MEMHRYSAEKHGPLEADHSASQGGVTLSYVCLHWHRFQLEDYIWCISSGHGKKQCNWWCAACGGSTVGQPRTESWPYKQHGPPRCKSLSGTCSAARSLRQLDHCAQALGKPPERWRQPSQDCGVQGLQERNRLRIMDGSSW